MDLTSHPLVVRARRLATDLLIPEAERVDQEWVPAGHVEAVKRSGLLGVAAPAEYGGAGAPPAVLRETAEILAGACCATWFVQTQHHTPVQTLAHSGLPVRERLLGPLSRGELLSGVAYAHLRSYPRRPVRVRREGTGWRFDGTVPWYTGWGLNDVMLLAGVTDSDEVLFAFTEAREQPGLRASPPMRLAALTAARTVSLELDGLWLPAEAVALHTPYVRWAAGDRVKTLTTSPAVFGVAEAALSLLDDETATPLRSRLAGLRERAYALADAPVPEAWGEERGEERGTVRAEEAGHGPAVRGEGAGEGLAEGERAGGGRAVRGLRGGEEVGGRGGRTGERAGERAGVGRRGGEQAPEADYRGGEPAATPDHRAGPRPTVTDHRAGARPTEPDHRAGARPRGWDDWAEERLAVRAEAYEVLRAATTAAVVAGGGRAMALTNRAQRLAREGLFLLVQGQTAESRAAHLRALSGAPAATGERDRADERDRT
ncbi:acyl-CoA dehydrogenase family protein [Streptomyces sp. NPDC052727]|uniref:acyl-CoA dehydrogenase family protein n=1 Tax=Streptomyces sp. NPDC052727 TaxID=3154854 RepID=UPI00341D6777